MGGAEALGRGRGRSENRFVHAALGRGGRRSATAHGRMSRVVVLLRVMSVAGTFGLLLLLFADPGVGVIGNLGDDQKVIPAERIRRLPFLAIAIDAGELGVESDAVVGVIAPDGGANGAHSKFVGGFVTGGFWRWHGFMGGEWWGAVRAMRQVARRTAWFPKINSAVGRGVLQKSGGKIG